MNYTSISNENGRIGQGGNIYFEFEMFDFEIFLNRVISKIRKFM